MKKIILVASGLLVLKYVLPYVFKSSFIPGETGVVIGSTGDKQAFESLINKAKMTYPYVSPVPTGLVLSLINAESSGQPMASGVSSEYGLMQILPTTFKWITNKYKLPDNDPYEPYTNIIAGMHVLMDYYNHPDIMQDWFNAIFAYNVGPGGFKQGLRNWDHYNRVVNAWINKYNYPQ